MVLEDGVYSFLSINFIGLQVEWWNYFKAGLSNKFSMFNIAFSLKIKD